MKIWTIALILSGLYIYSYALPSDNLSPSQRKILSSSWLDTGKTYYDNHKKIKARECFKFSNELYPMGADAREARNLLKKYFNLNVTYDPEKQYTEYIKRAASIEEPLYKLNSLLMALEIKQDKGVLYESAVLFNKLNNRDKASEYLKKALDAGYPPDSIDPALKDLVK
jgi:tetratricopeptide (TPR) repeat protein